MVHNLIFDITEISLKSYLVEYVLFIEDFIAKLSVTCLLVLSKMSLNYSK